MERIVPRPESRPRPRTSRHEQQRAQEGEEEDCFYDHFENLPDESDIVLDKNTAAFMKLLFDDLVGPEDVAEKVQKIKDLGVEKPKVPRRIPVVAKHSQKIFQNLFVSHLQDIVQKTVATALDVQASFLYNYKDTLSNEPPQATMHEMVNVLSREGDQGLVDMMYEEEHGETWRWSFEEALDYAVQHYEGYETITESAKLRLDDTYIFRQTGGLDIFKPSKT